MLDAASLMIFCFVVIMFIISKYVDFNYKPEADLGVSVAESIWYK